jgi:hypothetical protein
MAISYPTNQPRIAHHGMRIGVGEAEAASLTKLARGIIISGGSQRESVQTSFGRRGAVGADQFAFIPGFAMWSLKARICGGLPAGISRIAILRIARPILAAADYRGGPF